MSASPVVTQVVNKATTTTTLASSPNPSHRGESVTFSATVTPQFGGAVSGTVQFIQIKEEDNDDDDHDRHDGDRDRDRDRDGDRDRDRRDKG